MKTSHSKCTFMHTFFCEIKAVFLTFSTVIVKKKKRETMLQPSATSKHSFLGFFQVDLCHYVTIACGYSSLFLLHFS